MRRGHRRDQVACGKHGEAIRRSADVRQIDLDRRHRLDACLGRQGDEGLRHDARTRSRADKGESGRDRDEDTFRAYGRKREDCRASAQAQGRRSRRGIVDVRGDGLPRSGGDHRQRKRQSGGLSQAQARSNKLRQRTRARKFVVALLQEAALPNVANTAGGEGRFLYGDTAFAQCVARASLSLGR